MTPRIVLAGNNLAAVLVLDLILELAGKDNVLCIAPPFSHHWQPSLIDHARKKDVAYIAPEDVNDLWVIETVAAFRPSLFLSVYYTQLFRPALLEAVDCPVLNFHPSLLPRHRGVAPLIWAIMEGDRSTGLTLHHVDSGIDTGPIVKQWEIGIDRAETGYSLHQKMARQVEEMAKEVFRDHLNGDIDRGIAQVGEVSYHSRDQDLRHLDWTQPRERIRNIVRANCPPLHGAYLMVEGWSRNAAKKSEKISWARKIVLGQVEPDDSWGTACPPGTVAVASDGGFDNEECDVAVWASDGPLRIDSFQEGALLRPGHELAGMLKHGQVVT